MFHNKISANCAKGLVLCGAIFVTGAFAYAEKSDTLPSPLSIVAEDQSGQDAAAVVAEAQSEVAESRSDAVSRGYDRIGLPVSVSVQIDGASQNLVISGKVRDALLAADVVLEPEDVVTQDLDTDLSEGMQIIVGRGATATVTETEELPFEIEERQDPTLLVGTQRIVQTGVKGQAVTTYDVVLIDGQEASRTVVTQNVITAPRTQIVKVGALNAPAVGSADGSSVVSPQEAKAIGKAMVLERGWSEAEYACLESLWNKESGWRVTAANPSSGAYGIPQSLPGSKMGSVAADWKVNATTQIQWGLGYIAGRYGTPCGAWAHSQAKNWY